MAAGLDNGTIVVIVKKEDSFKIYTKEKAHIGAVYAISWAPEYTPIVFDSDSIENEKLRLQFISGGADCRASMWEFDESN